MGRRSVTPETALRLARYFDTTAKFWLHLQSKFDGLRAFPQEEPRKP
jgi:addiction module HigA family antidote